MGAASKTMRAQQAFLDALQATDRQALNRFVAAQGGAMDAAHKEMLKRDFMRLPLLENAALRELAHDTLRMAQGSRVTTTTWTEWLSIEHTWGGSQRMDSWENYGRRHLEWAQLVFPKGQGPVYNPTTNAQGYRNNARTQAMHALHLDADGVGDWWALLQILRELHLACLIHRSGGHTPELPKWRIVLPLARPYFIGGEEREVLAWRNSYASARVIFGTLARLTGPGFDPATDGPHHPWFPAARRRVLDAVREVYQNHGATLDLDALLAHLPRPPVPHGRVHPPQAIRTSSPSLLKLAFEAAGMLGRHLGGGKFAVICPWNHLHTEPLKPTEEPTSSTVIFPANSEMATGHFYCSHACGSRRLQEVLDALPAHAVVHARSIHASRPGVGPLPERLPRLSQMHGLPRFSSHLPR